MNKHDFVIGGKAKIRAFDEHSDKLYETVIRAIMDDCLCFDIPKVDGKMIVPPINSVIYGNFVKDNKVYFFSTRLFRIMRIDDVPVLVVEMPVDFERIQRRDFLRMDVFFPIESKIEISQGVFTPPIKTDCLDISGGGLRFVFDAILAEGKLIKVKIFDFPSIGDMELDCIVVRSTQSVYSGDKYWIGARFIDLPRKLEDKITKYIFEIQKRIVISSC